MTRRTASFGWTLAAALVVAGALGSLLPLGGAVSAQSPADFGVINNTTTSCPSDCCGHGNCVFPPPDANVTAPYCQCYPGFLPPDCGDSDANFTRNRSCCPQGCVYGDCIGDACYCNPGWGGSRCDQQTCPNDCSGHGTCYYGTCYCDLGWQGTDCSSQVISCPNDCSFRGVCGGDGICQCNPGATGDDCSLPQGTNCPAGCNGNGHCIAQPTGDRCLCKPGFGALDCSIPTCTIDADCQNGNNPCALSTCDPGSGMCTIAYHPSASCIIESTSTTFACFIAADKAKAPKPPSFVISSGFLIDGSSTVEPSKVKQLCQMQTLTGESVFIKMYDSKIAKGQPKFQPTLLNVTPNDPMFPAETIELKGLASIGTPVSITFNP
jgi:hypothetical protein